MWENPSWGESTRGKKCKKQQKQIGWIGLVLNHAFALVNNMKGYKFNEHHTFPKTTY